MTFGSDDFAGTLELTNSSATDIEINIDIPQGDAVLGSGRWNVASASTQSETDVESAAVVSSLKVKAGDVTIQPGAQVTKVARTVDMPMIRR